VPATGFTRVLSSIFTRLVDRFDTHIIGIGYKGPEMMVEGVTIHPCNLKGGDMFGQYQAEEFVRRHRPEIVFLLNDIWILDKYMPHLAPYQDSTRIVCYSPLDGRLLDDTLVAPFSVLAPSSRFVVYTEFARFELQQAIVRLAQAQEGFTFPGVEVVPHGVDTQTFYPVPGSVERQLEPAGRLAAKQLLFPGVPDMEDSFVVLNANRAQSRKRIDLTLQGFALFARDKPRNVRLVLHHAVPYGDALAQVQRQVEALGMTHRVKMGPEDESGVTNEGLNLIYNACDVGINTSMGEGWGLVSFEHAATGAAQIVPRHSASAELWATSAELVEPVAAYVPDFAMLEMQEVAPEGVAAALERLYADEAHRRDMSLRAYRNATRPDYRWEHIAQQWSRLFSDMGAGQPLPTT
jgi:glycosyltransferase involved in cell wall biosynthesis